MLHHRDFQADPRSTGAVRQFVAEALEGSERLNDIVLTASELASNAVRHADTPYTVRLEREAGSIRLEISDGSSIVPTLEGLGESHRGLRIVTAVCDRWGVEETDAGKTVWAEFATDA